MRVDKQLADSNLVTSLEQLSSSAGVDLLSVAYGCIGAAGSNIPLVADWIRESLGVRVGGSLLLVEDIEIALNAAFPGTRGVLLLAGTGSNAAARSDNGTLIRAGGWGPVLGDQGSGYAIGILALRNLFTAIDDGLQSDLLIAILQFWRLDSISSLIEHVHSNPPPDFSQLVRLVVEAATDGDSVASATLTQAGNDLAHLASSVIRKLQLSEGTDWTDNVQVALAGSVLQEIGVVRVQMELELRQNFPNVIFPPGLPDPVMGALWQARLAHRASLSQRRTNELE